MPQPPNRQIDVTPVRGQSSSLLSSIDHTRLAAADFLRRARDVARPRYVVLVIEGMFGACVNDTNAVIRTEFTENESTAQRRTNASWLDYMQRHDVQRPVGPRNHGNHPREFMSTRVCRPFDAVERSGVLTRTDRCRWRIVPGNPAFPSDDNTISISDGVIVFGFGLLSARCTPGVRGPC